MRSCEKQTPDCVVGNGHNGTVACDRFWSFKRWNGRKLILGQLLRDVFANHFKQKQHSVVPRSSSRIVVVIFVLNLPNCEAYLITYVVIEKKYDHYSPLKCQFCVYSRCNQAILVHADSLVHDDVIKWEHFPRNWPFVRGIHLSPVNSPHKGQWRGALMFSLIWVWINGWVNNREAGDLRRYRAHYDVTVIRC